MLKYMLAIPLTAGIIPLDVLTAVSADVDVIVPVSEVVEVNGPSLEVGTEVKIQSRTSHANLGTSGAVRNLLELNYL